MSSKCPLLDTKYVLLALKTKSLLILVLSTDFSGALWEVSYLFDSRPCCLCLNWLWIATWFSQLSHKKLSLLPSWSVATSHSMAAWQKELSAYLTTHFENFFLTRSRSSVCWICSLSCSFPCSCLHFCVSLGSIDVNSFSWAPGPLLILSLMRVRWWSHSDIKTNSMKWFEVPKEGCNFIHNLFVPV